MTGSQNSKRKAPSKAILGLHGKNDVITFLRSAGFDVDRAVRDAFGEDKPVGVLLVGSVAEGYQTPSSDIDLLFITYAERDSLRSSEQMVIWSGRSSETLTYADGIEINTEVICRDDYALLADQLDQVGGAAAMGSDLTKLPMLDKYALRFLHRLRTGIVLFGSDVAEEFRADFHVGSLPLYLSVRNLVLAREALEDARSASTATTGLVEFICHNTLEYCLFAFTSSLGFTSQSRRFVMNWLDSLGENDPHREALYDLRARFIEGRMLSPEEKPGLIEQVAGTYEMVRTVLREDPVRRQVIDQVFDRIAYSY